MKYLVTGGCGFLGSNIASSLLLQGHELIIFDNLSRFGSYQNLEWLRQQGIFEFIHGDIRNSNDVESLVCLSKPDVIYHLAGQVAMTTSIADPRKDFQVNTLGSFNLLDAVRLHSPGTTLVYSSTNKVYGDLEQFKYREAETRYECIEKPNGFDETVSLDFHSPYGVSKGSADQYMLDFSRIYGLKTIVFRHSSMFGGRQFATYDQGWVGWFASQVKLQQREPSARFTVSGNGKQVRDILHARDCIDLYLMAPQFSDIMYGQAFNVGGGIERSMSIIELLDKLGQIAGITVRHDFVEARISDQRVFVADSTKLKKLIGWTPKVSIDDGLTEALNWADQALNS
jgi:CDP-paratose 2-epimerase